MSEHTPHCVHRNRGNTIWTDDDGVTQGYRCTCERRSGEERRVEGAYTSGPGSTNRRESDRRADR